MATIWLSLLHYYTNVTGFLAYLFVGQRKIKLVAFDFLVVCNLICLFLYQIYQSDIVDALINFRFYWGWIVFYLIFKATPPSKKTIVDALVVLSILTLIEAVLINTVIEPHLLPNFPSYEAGMSEWKHEGGYQRPYSFGASATVGASILVVLIALCGPEGWRLWLSISAVLVFASGTGTIALSLVMVLRYGVQILKMSLSLGITLLLADIFLGENLSVMTGLFFAKVDPDYASYLMNYKIESIYEVYEKLTAHEIIFGYEVGFRGGDFGILAFALHNGFVGLILLLTIILFRGTRKTAIPLFLILGTSFHYPVVFFLPGQMIFGLILSLDKRGFAELPLFVKGKNTKV